MSTKNFWVAVSNSFRTSGTCRMLRLQYGWLGEIFALAAILCASRSDTDGFLMVSPTKPYSPLLFAQMEELPTENAQAIFDMMEDLEFLQRDSAGRYYLTDWDVYNRPRKDRENNARYQKEYRARQHKVTVTEPSDELPAETLGSKKSKKVSPIVSDEAIRLANLLASRILEHTPDFLPLANGNRDKTVAAYAADFDKVLRIDKRNAAEVERVIAFATGDRTPGNNGFCWAKIILSAANLRKKYESLRAQMGKTGSPSLSGAAINTNPAAMARNMGI